MFGATKWIRKLAVACCCLMALWVAPAGANPIVMGRSEAVQVPQSAHVQVSYLCDFVEDSGGWPVGLTRDGQSLDTAWVGPTWIEINGGSGLGDYPAKQACDCNVPVGRHEYEILLDNDAGGYPCAMTTLRVSVTDPPPGPQEACVPADPDDYEFPWDIPECAFPRGLNCVTWCAEHEPAPEPPRCIPTIEAPVSTAGVGLIPILAAFFLVFRRRKPRR